MIAAHPDDKWFRQCDIRVLCIADEADGLTSSAANFRFGSKAISTRRRRVIGFSLNSRHDFNERWRLLWAKS